jgi:hypothetical protein
MAGRVVVSAIAFAVFAGVFVSCGGSSAGAREAEHAAVRWLKAMATSDLKTACELMDAENHSPTAEYPSWNPAKSCRVRWLHSDNTPLSWKPKPHTVSIWGEDHPKVLRVDIEGDRATVFVNGIGGNERPVWLRMEHGHWLVDGASYPV